MYVFFNISINNAPKSELLFSFRTKNTGNGSTYRI